MPRKYLRPRALELRHIDTLHIGAQLTDVDITLALPIEAMEQHALLHRRERIQVLHLACRQRQLVQLLLGQPGQRYIGRSESALLRVDAMRNQCQQLLPIIIRQPLNSRRLEHLSTEPPLQRQLTAIDLPFHRQPVGQRCLWILGLATALAGRHEQCRFVELAVELAQVVERDARRGQGRQRFAGVRRAEVT
ncbi:hypothetical protein PFL603g_06249 [Pseudomonas fluorescens]|uniref:Uncharacterized protein n=1 Tax=Pseudomonas fluorescens TaxID=294 RepID=A0A109KIF0_PSEFL|nr:hypothetical protein PFL603g_06249 [Pseudomonas fluorescens]